MEMIYTQKNDIQEKLKALKAKGQKIGFVATMGALHKGHLTLVSKALKENDTVVVSIFVNPTQFNNAEDLEKYPRTLEDDISLLNTLTGNILIYSPTPNELYGDDVVSTSYDFGGIENEMEGAFREGHFDGVGTVLNLFFRVLNPDRAYFGEKDFQQLQIVRKLVEIEKLPVQIVGCTIARTESGLAMSSRNKRLTPQQFKEAAFIYKTLKAVKDKFRENSIPNLREWVYQEFSQNPHLQLEYFEIAPIHTLKSALRKRKGNTYRGFIAVFAGEVRLIDNIALN